MCSNIFLWVLCTWMAFKSKLLFFSKEKFGRQRNKKKSYNKQIMQTAIFSPKLRTLGCIPLVLVCLPHDAAGGLLRLHRVAV